MKIAYLIQCHQKPEMINLLIEKLGSNCTIFVHVDATSDISNDILMRDNVSLVKKRYDVKWGDVSQIYATLELLKCAVEKGFDYVTLLSGQCYPIVDEAKVKFYLSENSGAEFIEYFMLPNKKWRYQGGIGRVKYSWPKGLIARKDILSRLIRNLYLYTLGRLRSKDIRELGVLYGGSQWFTITSELAKYILDYINRNPKYLSLYDNSGCADEIFFQTLIMNSPFKNNVINDNLRYIKWEKGKNSPSILLLEDLEDIINSRKLFMRKVDAILSKSLLDKIG